MGGLTALLMENYLQGFRIVCPVYLYLVQFPVRRISDVQFKGNEDDRMSAMLDFLQKATSDRGIVCGKLGGVSTHYCPFSGGGDLYIKKNGNLSPCLHEFSTSRGRRRKYHRKEKESCAVDQLTKKHFYSRVIQ